MIDTGPEVARVVLEGEVAKMGADVEELMRRVDHLVVAVAEGIERTDRAERRIRDTVKRARKELKAAGLENPGMEAEAEQLRLVDGDGGADGGLRPLPAPVESAAPEASSIKGVSLETLQRARGY